MTTGCLYHPIARRGMNLCSPGNRGLFPACSRKALRQRFSNFLESPCSLPFWPSRSRQMELFNGEGCRQLLRSSWFSFACSFFLVPQISGQSDSVPLLPLVHASFYVRLGFHLLAPFFGLSPFRPIRYCSLTSVCSRQLLRSSWFSFAFPFRIIRKAIRLPQRLRTVQSIRRFL